MHSHFLSQTRRFGRHYQSIQYSGGEKPPFPDDGEGVDYEKVTPEYFNKTAFSNNGNGRWLSTIKIGDKWYPFPPGLSMSGLTPGGNYSITPSNYPIVDTITFKISSKEYTHNVRKIAANSRLLTDLGKDMPANSITTSQNFTMTYGKWDDDYSGSQFQETEIVWTDITHKWKEYTHSFMLPVYDIYLIEGTTNGGEGYIKTWYNENAGDIWIPKGLDDSVGVGTFATPPMPAQIMQWKLTNNAEGDTQVGKIFTAPDYTANTEIFAGCVSSSIGIGDNTIWNNPPLYPAYYCTGGWGKIGSKYYKFVYIMKQLSLKTLSVNERW